jgi:hypothetical protein
MPQQLPFTQLLELVMAQQHNVTTPTQPLDLQCKPMRARKKTKCISTLSEFDECKMLQFATYFGHHTV